LKVLFTVNLENRSAADADLLQSFVSDAVRSFATRTSSKADVERVRLFANEFDPLAEYYTSRSGSLQRRDANYARPGKPS
jgi:hypothetical protein